MNSNKKNLINLLIGIILIILGYYFYLLKVTFLHYLGFIMIIYGSFVSIVKTSKIIFLFNRRFKNIRKFEDNENLLIPNFIKEILEFRIRNNKEVTFELPYFGSFSVLNYNNEDNNLDNPSYLKKEILN